MMMMTNTGHIMTLANSIIGVGILAMPFCFQKCGVILSVLLLIVNNLITRISCHYLIKSSVITRRKSFEFLAFHTFGSSGKLMVELCIIGYLLGTCIAYFVVVGDLGPQIIGKIFNLSETTIKLRSLIMITVTFLCIIPLGLLRNVDSLSTVCTASIGFYFCLVFKVIGESTTHLLNNNYWLRNIEYWKPSGILQCLPIFSMALACQIQLFEVLNTLPNPSIEKMNRVVNVATMICTYVYILVGFFGYIAFSNQTFSGNILVHLSPSLASDAIKMGFVLSVAFSFPLVIFPCRASIYSLLYRKGHIDTTGYIPEFRFKVITTSIILFSLFIGILIPSIELVIGLVGSTIGIAICIMFPALCFMKISKKESSEKSLAQFILIGGFCLMILGTYANLNAIDEKHSGLVTIDDEHNKIIQNTNNLINNNNKNKDNNNNDFGIKSFKNHSDNLKNVKDKTQLVLNNNNNKQIENNKTIIMKQKNQEEKQLINKSENNDNKNQNYKENLQTLTEKYVEKSSNNFLNNIKNVNVNNNNNNLNDDNENEKTKNINEKLSKNQQILNFINNNNNNNNNRNDENEKENNQINMNNIEIDKDAIKKDEEITAEEELKNKNKHIIIDNSDTANELVKTKKLLEIKVDELKEQLAKHNVETQNLVAEKLGDIVQKVKQIEKQVYKDNNNNNNNDNIIKNNNDNNTKTNKLNIETINTINEKNNNEKISSVIENDKVEFKNNNKLNNNEIENKIQIKKNISKNDDKKLNIKENQINQQPLPLPLLINATVIKQHQQQQQEHQKSQNLINNNDDNNNNNNNNQYQSLPPNINDNNLKNLNVKNSNNKLEDNNEQNNNNVNNIDSIRRDILGVVTNKDIIVITSTPSLPLSNSNIINEKNKNIDNNDNNLREKRELTKGSCINWDLNNIDCLDIKNNNNNNINDDDSINENINHNNNNNNNNNNNKNNNFHINDDDNNKKAMLQSIGRDLKSIKEKT